MDQDTLIELMFELAKAKRATEDKRADVVTLLLGEDTNADASFRQYGAACAAELNLEVRLGQALLMYGEPE